MDTETTQKTTNGSAGEFKWGFPEEVRVENTNLCNARCVICPREKMNRAQGVMPMALFRKIIDECASQGCVRRVNIQGYGEPLLDPEFCEKVRYAKSKGMPVTYTVTNASILTEKLSFDIVQSGLDKMKVSFYGTNAHEYALVHKGLSFDKVRENVLLLLDVKRRLRSRTPRVRLQYIGSPMKFIKFAFQWIGRTPVGFSKLHNYGKGRSYVRVRVDKRRRRCRMVSRPISQILWNGDVVPCCYDFNGDLVLGNVGRASIREIWNGPEYRKFREAHAEGRFSEYSLCLRCDKLR
jgi:radical SAM protein with 4Fe4S-binding SPASM domain